ncbi:MAG: hypothetical protein ABW224_12845 [Kibdelosporangium sp.]
MSRRAYLSWLAAGIVSVVAFAVIQIRTDWPASIWVNVPVILVGIVSLAQCCRWHLHRHRAYVAAKLSARAAADHARSRQR